MDLNVNISPKTLAVSARVSGVEALKYNTEGNYNVAVGSDCNVSSSSAANQTVLGYNATGNANDSLCFGNGTTDSAIAYGATSITAPSDIRLKENFKGFNRNLQSFKL